MDHELPQYKNEPWQRYVIQNNTANAPSPRIMALVPIHPSPFSKGELQPSPR